MSKEVLWEKVWILHGGEFVRVNIQCKQVPCSDGMVDMELKVYTLDKKNVLIHYWSDVFGMNSDKTLDGLYNKLERQYKQQHAHAKKLSEDADSGLRAIWNAYSDYRKENK